MVSKKGEWKNELSLELTFQERGVDLMVSCMWFTIEACSKVA